MLAKKVACEGTVLLKNNGILPLSDVKKIAVVGRYANKINVGDHGSSSVASPYTVTPYKGLCNAFGKENVVLCESLDISSKLDEIKSCSCVLICVGSDYKQEGENLGTSQARMVRQKRRTAATDIRCVFRQTRWSLFTASAQIARTQSLISSAEAHMSLKNGKTKRPLYFILSTAEWRAETHLQIY